MALQNDLGTGRGKFTPIPQSLDHVPLPQMQSYAPKPKMNFRFVNSKPLDASQVMVKRWQDEDEIAANIAKANANRAIYQASADRMIPMWKPWITPNQLPTFSQNRFAPVSSIPMPTGGGILGMAKNPQAGYQNFVNRTSNTSETYPKRRR